MGQQDAENPFLILGVEPGAPFAEVKKQYKKQVKTLHPDLDPSSLANARIKKLNWAYDEIDSLYSQYGEDMVRQLHSRGKKKIGTTTIDMTVNPVTDSIAEAVIAMQAYEPIQFEFLKRPISSLAAFTASCLVIFYILQGLAIEPFVNAYASKAGPNVPVQVGFWLVIVIGATLIWYPEFWLTVFRFQKASEDKQEKAYWGTQITGWVLIWIIPFTLHALLAEEWVGKTQVEKINERYKPNIVPKYENNPPISKPLPIPAPETNQQKVITASDPASSEQPIEVPMEVRPEQDLLKSDIPLQSQKQKIE